MYKFLVTLRNLFVSAVAGTALMLSAGVAAEEISFAEFRQHLTEWALASEPPNESGEQSLADKISLLSDEQMEIWFSTIKDPEAFLVSMDQVVRRIEGERNSTPASRAMEVSKTTTRTATTLTTPFQPDYPPGSGAYNDTVLNAIDLFNISGASDVDRCSNADWGDYVGVWWPLNEAFDALDGACVVAGCDPIGIGCAITCGILETAKVALKIAAVPLEACDVHQGAIDGAEIEATYENLLGLLGDVAHIHSDLAEHDTNIAADLASHDTNIDTDLAAHDANIDADLIAHDTTIKAQLATHDSDIKSQLTTHDADIKALLANIQGSVDENQRLIKIAMSRQLEIMRLLITPQGQRTLNSEVLTCTGDNCPLAAEVISCQSLGWPCKK